MNTLHKQILREYGLILELQKAHNNVQLSPKVDRELDAERKSLDAFLECLREHFPKEILEEIGIPNSVALLRQAIGMHQLANTEMHCRLNRLLEVSLETMQELAKQEGIQLPGVAPVQRGVAPGQRVDAAEWVEKLWQERQAKGKPD